MESFDLLNLTLPNRSPERNQKLKVIYGSTIFRMRKAHEKFDGLWMDKFVIHHHNNLPSKCFATFPGKLVGKSTIFKTLLSKFLFLLDFNGLVSQAASQLWYFVTVQVVLPFFYR